MPSKWPDLLGDTLPEVVAAARAWSLSPLTFFDASTLIAFLLGAAAWLMAGLTARDLDALIDPTMYLGETEPTARLVRRYFAGGAVLLICTAFSRVDLGALIEMENARIRNPILNVLLYFFLGLVMLGQIQFSRLSGLWRREKVTVGGKPERPLDTLYACLYRTRGLHRIYPAHGVYGGHLGPGRYVGIRDQLRRDRSSTHSFFGHLRCCWRSFRARNRLLEAPSTSEVPFAPPPPPVADMSGGAWWAVVRSIVFWAVLLTVVFYLVRSYLRDRSELRTVPAAVRTMAVARRRRGTPSADGCRPGDAPSVRQVPALVRRVLSPRERTRKLRRTRGRSLREQLRYTYLVTLDRAAQQGIPRRQTETPYEYGRKLGPHLAEGNEALEALTRAFIEARYSTHPITAEDVAAQQANAERVRRGLRPEDK